MNIENTSLTDVKVICPSVFGDDRGFFYESFNENKFCSLTNTNLPFVQDNHSRSSKGVLRGLHYQIVQAQGKLVRCTLGAVYDVVVDIRKNSPQFGQSFGIELSSQNKKMLWVPPGFAHGFYVMSDYAEFLYKTTDYWAPQFERTLLWNDPILNIQWPLAENENPLLSAKDAKGITLAECEVYP